MRARNTGSFLRQFLASRRILFASGLVLPALAGAVVLVLYLDYYAIDFRTNLWEPAFLLVQGQSPYGVQKLPPDQPHFAMWFPQVIGLFFPLGWLPLRIAANLWLLGSLATLGGLIVWWRREAPSLSPLLLTLAAILFPPVLIHFNSGQFDLAVVLLLSLSAHLVIQRRCFLAGLPLALALAKPHLAMLVLPGLLLACARRGKVRDSILLSISAALGSAFLTLPLWIGYPDWVGDFLRQLREAPPWLQPSLYTMSQLWFGKPALVVPVLISAGVFALNLWLWWRYPPEEVMPWSLALTTIACPYIWTWDFVLFLPLIFRSLHREREWPARAIWGLGYALCWGLVVAFRLAFGESYQWHFWMPWLLFGLVLAAHWAENRRAGRRPLLRRSEG